ncbi:MAG TPA: hypothetical protein VNZ52_15680 [Candidatus Thermoplasmatota archaeon]|nr:hypothetical protein [Candidatus Thermoplasmatota archaeon]
MISADLVAIAEAEHAVLVDTAYGRFIFSAASLEVSPDVTAGARVMLFVKPDGCLAVRVIGEAL